MLGRRLSGALVVDTTSHLALCAAHMSILAENRHAFLSLVCPETRQESPLRQTVWHSMLRRPMGSSVR